MARLNRYNFLRWDGAFDEIVHTITAVNDAFTMYVSESSKKFAPLNNDIATLGFNYTSMVITQDANPENPTVVNKQTGEITFSKPSAAISGSIYTLKYRFKDIMNHLSNEGTITITFTERASAWRGYVPSTYCVKDGMYRNTGYAGWNQLEKYYTDDNSSFQPLTLKPNVDTDPNYIAPILNETLCPVNEITLNYDFGVWDAHLSTGLSFYIKVQGGATLLEITTTQTGFIKVPEYSTLEVGVKGDANGTDYLWLNIQNSSNQTIFNGDDQIAEIKATITFQTDDQPYMIRSSATGM